MKGEYLKLETVKTIAELLNENKDLRQTINDVIEYVDKMSYAEVVDNPKKDLQKILKKEK